MARGDRGGTGTGFVDKFDRLGGTDLRLELGCGTRTLPDEVIGIDLLDHPGVHVVGDVLDVLASLPGGSVTEVGSSHFLEHVDDLDGLLVELGRVVRPGGTMRMVVPHWSNPYFYSDPTHSRFFGLYTFDYLAHCALFQRSVPDYGTKVPFDVTDVWLDFRGAPAGRLQAKARWEITRFVNRSAHRQELYEAHLTRFVSCFEMTFTLVRRTPRA